MCQQPQKILIHFYDPKEDMSLGHKVKDWARSAVHECPKCKELKLQHITSYYHKNGYVEVRLKSERHLKNEVETLYHEL